MTIAIVQGTRPEIIKNDSIVQALRDRGVPVLVLHTNQHWSVEMRDGIYGELGYRPDRVYNGRGGIGATIEWLQATFDEENVRHVLANGDTAASLAAAVAALYRDIPMTHVEAGLRSGDSVMLEERNRIVVDAIASILFVYTDYELGVLNQADGIRGKVFLEGNTTVDLTHQYADRIRKAPVPGDYIYLTLHRRELTDDPNKLDSLLQTFSTIAERVCPVVFPVHPRTADSMARHGLLRRRLSPDLRLLEPVSVFESLSYQRHACLVATDSGCVQEEAYILGTPCITLRDNTERHLTVRYGANALVGFDPARIHEQADVMMCRDISARPPIYGAPGAGARIVDRLLDEVGDSERIRSRARV